MEIKKRMSAKKARIKDIVSGKYFAGSKEDMMPSFVITPLGQRLSRISIIATVTDKFLNEDESYASVTVDDGTAAVRVKTFREGVGMLKKTEVGNLVAVTGKLKEYNGEVYVSGEFVKKIDDANYESMQKLEILNELLEQKKIIDEIKNLKEQMPEDELKEYAKDKFGMDNEAIAFVLENLKVVKEVDYKPKILKLIESLDEGKGVEISKLLELSDLPENIIDNTLNDLLNSGDLFEPTAGRLKRIKAKD